MFCTLVFTTFVSCSNEHANGLTLLSGFLSWIQQDWGNAASSYLRVAESARAENNTRLFDYAVYGLAATYLAQDEYDSALIRLSEISSDASDEVAAGLWYQIGVAAYRKQQYGLAGKYFRKSLEIEPAALDAKINLELCSRSLVTNESAAAAAPKVGESRQKDDEAELLFNLVRRKEQDRWKNQQAEQTPSEVEDY